MFVDSTNGCSTVGMKVKKLHSFLSMGWNKIMINVSFVFYVMVLTMHCTHRQHQRPGFRLLAFTTIQNRISKA